MVNGIDDREISWGYMSKICSSCKHWRRGKFSKEREIKNFFTWHLCDAFPKGIPEVIWKGENNHLKPFKGDNGIQFEKE